jgi:hypothetical protein
MIVYKLYKYSQLEEIHVDYFNSLLEEVRKQNILSPSIDEIIITDDIDGEITRYCKNRLRQPKLTRNREYIGIAKTVKFDNKKKIFFDFINVNSYLKYTPQIFFEQIIRVYAEDIVSNNYTISKTYTADTPYPDIIKMLFAQWTIEVVSYSVATNLNFNRENLHLDVKMFTDAFKRNIRKLHYQYQEEMSYDDFWINTVTELDAFIRRCLDLKHDNGSFLYLQEFIDYVPPLLIDIEIQTKNLLEKKDIDLLNIQTNVLKILNKCSINIPKEGSMSIEIADSPKNLFKNTIIDTEPRIVAFIDILGFSAIIDEYDSDKTSNILNELHDTLEMAIKIAIEDMKDPKLKSDLKEYLEYRMFSDCLCISLPYIEYGNDFHIQFHSLTSVVKAYQLAMMQKGFYVRGGISIGSFYADKNMIFSGGLVKAYKLEQTIVYPVIAIDKSIMERLKINFIENSKGLFYENTMLYTENEANKIFLNPYDFLDKSIKYLDYLQSTMDNLIDSNSKEEDDSSIAVMNTLLKITNSLTKPVFENAKSQLNSESMNKAKATILDDINDKLVKYNKICNSNEPESNEYNETQKIIVKFEYLKNLTEWSMGKRETDLFKYYQFI